MSEKLDVQREISTFNGRQLRYLSRTIDGGLVLQSAKSRMIVVTDECGRIDGKDYAVNRDRLRTRGSPLRSPVLTPGQAVFCFRYARKERCTFRAVFIGHVKASQVCKVAPEEPLSGRDILKLSRQQVFESLEELQGWWKRVQSEIEL